MSTAMTTPTKPIGATEAALIKGDLGQLDEAQRLAYYREVCESLGLNPLTQPFGYIKFQGQLKLYAKRDCADQLRKLNAISVEITSQQHDGDLYIVTARARDQHGRQDTDCGAVAVKGLVGEALANAIMKAMTKAKRRVTLSICGLGWLDETEVETVPGAEVVQSNAKPALPAPTPQTNGQPKPRGPQLPASGEELAVRLRTYDAKLAKEGTIQAGELVAFVVDAGRARGYDPDLAKWSGPAIQFAVDQAKAFSASPAQLGQLGYPVTPPIQRISAAQHKEICDLLRTTGEDPEEFCRSFSINDTDELPKSRMEAAVEYFSGEPASI